MHTWKAKSILCMNNSHSEVIDFMDIPDDLPYNIELDIIGIGNRGQIYKGV